MRVRGDLIKPQKIILKTILAAVALCYKSHRFKIANINILSANSRVSRLGSVTARHSSSGRQPNCGVEQRAPPIFGRATITLGIGPHSSYILHFYTLDERSRVAIFNNVAYIRKRRVSHDYLK